jgi:kynurenine formamidase
MKTRQGRLAAALMVMLAAGQGIGAPAPLTEGRLVDLSHSFDANAVFWPTADRFKLEVESAGYNDSGYYYAANNFCTSEHGGTHLDAPVHFAEHGLTSEAIPLERLVGPGAVVYVSAASARDSDYLVTVADLEAWEKRHGTRLDGRIVLLRTGFSDRWPDAEHYLGTAERGPDAVPKLHFPGLAPAAAAWLTREREVRAVGIDTASIDAGQSNLFEAHRTLFAANVPAFENVTALDRLPGDGFTVIALPMKIAGGSGGPLRIIAILPP